MKHLDTVHSFHNLRTFVSRGLYRVRSFAGPSGTVVLLTDLGSKNDGPSVTNAVEEVIQSLLEQGLVIAPARFIEHYERDTLGRPFQLYGLTADSLGGSFFLCVFDGNFRPEKIHAQLSGEQKCSSATNQPHRHGYGRRLGQS